MNAGIIAIVRTAHWRRLLYRVIDNIDSETKSIYNLDTMTSMRFIKMEWEYIATETISNCCDHLFREVPSNTERQNGTLDL